MNRCVSELLISDNSNNILGNILLRHILECAIGTDPFVLSRVNIEDRHGNVIIEKSPFHPAKFWSHGSHQAKYLSLGYETQYHTLKEFIVLWANGF